MSTDAAGDLDVANLSSLVAAAAGIDTERGDDVTVELVSFNTAGAKEAAEALAAAAADADAERMMELMRIGIIAAGILIPFILGLIVYARRSSRQSRESIDVGELRTGLDEPTIPLLQAAPFPTRVITPGPPISYEPTTAEKLREEIDALAHRDSKGTAQYLRGFMDERQPA